MLLASGASATIGDEVLNQSNTKVSSGTQKLMRPRPKPKVEPLPPVPIIVEAAAPPVVNIDMSEIAATNAQMMGVMMDMLKDRDTPVAPVVSGVPTEPTSWKFDIERDNNGFIKSMTAKPI